MTPMTIRSGVANNIRAIATDRIDADEVMVYIGVSRVGILSIPFRVNVGFDTSAEHRIKTPGEVWGLEVRPAAPMTPPTDRILLVTDSYNKLVELGSATFVDESVLRFGVHVSNAKMVVAGDVNGDGWVDVLFANAFNTDPPFLHINRGAAQPGYFDLESASRGLTEALSSSGASFGDIDDDGDLDLVLCDSGDSLLAGTGGRPRLYLNDGTGFFAEAPLQLPAAVKRAHMDVNLVDIDGDFDLDLLQANRATNSGGNHYLMRNDGLGTFSDASNLLPATTGSVLLKDSWPPADT